MGPEAGMTAHSQRWGQHTKQDPMCIPSGGAENARLENAGLYLLNLSWFSAFDFIKNIKYSFHGKFYEV